MFDCHKAMFVRTPLTKLGGCCFVGWIDACHIDHSRWSGGTSGARWRKPEKSEMARFKQYTILISVPVLMRHWKLYHINNRHVSHLRFLVPTNTTQRNTLGKWQSVKMDD